MKTKSESVTSRLKAAMSMTALLSSGWKTSGQPPAIHPPWNRARVRPAEEGEGSRDGLEERTGEGSERGDAGRRENKEGERGMETWGRSSRGGATNNGGRNVAERGEEHRGELPGCSSDAGILVDGSYFQTGAEARRVAPMKQKLNEAVSLISLSRRLHGPTRVGDEHWSNGRNWDGRRKEEDDRAKMHGSIGDLSVSALVSGRTEEEERRKGGGRRRGRQFGEESGSSEGWWRREERLYDSNSETGSDSKEQSQSEPSLSKSGSRASTEDSEMETEKTSESDSGTGREEGSQGTDRESETRSESGLESEDEGKESHRRRSRCRHCNGVSSKKRRRRSSANVERGGRDSARSSSRSSKSHRQSGSRDSSSRPKTSSRSSRRTIEQESEEEEESAEEEVEARRRRPSRGRNTSDRCQAEVMEAADDLSPIMEDTEEEEEEEEEDERSSDHEADLENKSAD